MLLVPFPEHRPSPVGGGALMETSRQGLVLESHLPLLSPLARLHRDSKASCVSAWKSMAPGELVR